MFRIRTIQSADSPFSPANGPTKRTRSAMPGRSSIQAKEDTLERAELAGFSGALASSTLPKLSNEQLFAQWLLKSGRS